MADLTPLAFDPANVEDMGDGFKIIPPQTAPVIIVESEVKPTKDGTGKILEIKNQIVEGPNVGDVVIDRLNIQNKSEVAQKIGLSQLKDICMAIGKTGQLKDSTELHGKVYSVKIVVEQFQSNTGKVLDSNKIEKRMPKQAVAVASAPATGTPPVASAAAPSLAWG